MNSNKKKIWEFPWKYRESFVITFAFLALGFILEYFSKRESALFLSFPHNLIVLISLILIIILAQKYIKHPFIKWLSSIYAAMSVICVFTALILTMGFIPQVETSESFFSKLGLTHIVRSFPYLVLSVFLLIILGFTTIRKLFPLNIKNFGFFLNHAGLFIVLSAASFGISDVETVYISVKEGETEWKAYDKNDKMIEMPIAIKLEKFTLEEYAPNLILVDSKSGKMLNQRKNEKLPEISKGMKCKLGKWEVEVLEYIPNAIMSNSKFIEAKDTMNSQAALIRAIDAVTNSKIVGWICAEGLIQMPVPIQLDANTQIFMAKAAAKKYKSKVKIYTKDQQIQDLEIEVNKPAHINGWDIYQNSYKQGMIEGGTISTFELIRDPWLIVVYSGIYMMLAGGIFMFWLGRGRIKN